jgi:diguanylate cyclase (GGDEF)-like protein
VHRNLTGTQRVVALSLAMAGAAAMLLAFVVDRDAAPVATFDLPAEGLLLAGLFFITEGFVVHLQLRRQTQSFSLSEVPFVIGLFFFPPAVLIAARLAGSVLALLTVRRQPVIKAIFNIAYFALDACLMVIVFRAALGGGEALGPRGWAAAHLAGVVGMIVGTLAVAAAIWLTERTTPPGLVRGVTGLGLPTAFVNVNLGLVAVTILDLDPRAGGLLLGLGVTLYFFYRSHTQLRANHESLGELYAVTRTVDDALEHGGAVQTLLERTADLMRAEFADLVLADPDGGSTRFSWSVAAGRLTTTRAGDLVAMRNEILGDEISVLLTGRKDRSVLEQLGHDDALIFGIRADGRLTGTLMVADRLGNVATFTDDDRRLFEALGNHASIAMRNSTLLERLRVEVVEREHEAMHDTLTQLPNRTLFDREVGFALRAMSGDRGVAVMLIDLDRFKEVNDTLGHQQGDRLLQHVSRRIANAVGDEGIVARLGGDEFAVLLPVCRAEEEAMVVAQRICETVEQPFDLDGLPIVVGASVGIATAPEDAADPESLLQRADVAMYTAKRGSGIQRYHAAANHYSPERLAMVAELRKAIEREELLVEYQPCIDLRTGGVMAAEALARWHHPEHGYVSPEVFIPIAERSGLIRGLTSHVMRTAIRQCAAWRREGLVVRVAVNLSARSLADDDLPAQIHQHLAEEDLPATALILEITESTIMDDPARTISMLNKLSSMGITLSIDDYGTGYSSLSYLKNLPVDELKLDRSFVTNMRVDPRDAVIVRNTIELAHELGLRVVAEGIEDAETQSLLAELGCDLAQGYHICRPRTSSQLHAFATERDVTLPVPISLVERRKRSATS